MRQRSLAPTRKVAAGAVADAVMVVLGYALEQGFHTTLPLPGLAVSYLTPPAPEDTPVPATRRRDPIN